MEEIELTSEENFSKIIEDNERTISKFFDRNYLKKKPWALPLAKSLEITGGIMKFAGKAATYIYLNLPYAPYFMLHTYTNSQKHESTLLHCPIRMN